MHVMLSRNDTIQLLRKFHGERDRHGGRNPNDFEREGDEGITENRKQTFGFIERGIVSQKQLQIFDTRCSFREISPCFLSILFSFSLLRRGPNFPATQLRHPTPFNFYSWQKYKQTTEKRCLSRYRYQCPTRLDIRGYIMYGLFKNS